jgi:CRP/FNR family transcriptional regulator, cyclic AMP receptor protein
METRKFLIAHQDQNVRNDLMERVEKIQGKLQWSISADGTDAGFRLENVHHHVVFLADDLPKQNALKLTERILKEKRQQTTAVIILSHVPDNEHFVDAVVSGRVHFLSDYQDSEQLEKCLMRALNYVFHGERDEEFNLRFLARGETLMKEGEKAENCYLVRQGQLRAVRHVDGREVFLGLIQVGEFVGEMAYINGEPRTADVLADSAAELIEIPFGRLDHVLFQKPSWSKALMRTLSKRLKIANELRASSE